MKRDVLGDQVKKWEMDTPSVLPSNQWTIIRIDGHCFHTFTKPFARPQDSHLNQAMVETTKDLCKEFNAVTGYTQSDEITLLIVPIPEKSDEKGDGQSLMFGGRKQKLESLTAGFASARFNFHLSTWANEVEDGKKKNAMMSGRAYFDSRVLTVPTPENAADVFWWRYQYDCFKNGISSISHQTFTDAELFKKSTSEQIKMLGGLESLQEKYPAHLLYGTFVKTQVFEKMCENQSTKTMQPCLRRKITEKCIPSESLLAQGSEQNCFVKIITSLTW